MEANAVALGVSIDTLMENAGRAVGGGVRPRLPPAPADRDPGGTREQRRRRNLRRPLSRAVGFPPRGLAGPALLRDPNARRPGGATSARRPALRVRVGVPTVSQVEGAALVLDALLGSSQSGELRSPYARGRRRGEREPGPDRSPSMCRPGSASPTVRPPSVDRRALDAQSRGWARRTPARSSSGTSGSPGRRGRRPAPESSSSIRPTRRPTPGGATPGSW